MNLAQVRIERNHKLMAFYNRLLQQLRQVLTQPYQELSRAQKTLRYLFDLVRHCLKQLQQDRAEEMAAALTYRTIFGLIPLFVLGLILFRAFGGFEEMQQKLQPAMFSFFGVPEADYDADQPDETQPTLIENVDLEEEIAQKQRLQQLDLQTQAQPLTQAAATQPLTTEQQQLQREQQEEDQQVRASIRKALSDLIAKVYMLDFATIGIAGVLLFIYAAIALAVSMEHDFNIIFKSPRGRPWHMRIAVYWAMVTLGSGLLALSLYLSNQVVNWVEDFEALGPLVGILGRFAALLASWLMLFLLYVLMPNTRVNVKPALIGSFIAALLWESGKVGFQAYVNNTEPYKTVYGSLGLIPLFLFWIYISWFITLFGLAFTYALQTMRGRQLQLEENAQTRDLMLDPRWLIPVMAIVGEAFDKGDAITASRIANQAHLPTSAVAKLGEKLESKGLLRRVLNGNGSEASYTLAKPPHRIAVADLLATVETMSLNERTIGDVPGHDLIDSLNNAQRQAADNLTLANLIRENR